MADVGGVVWLEHINLVIADKVSRAMQQLYIWGFLLLLPPLPSANIPVHVGLVSPTNTSSFDHPSKITLAGNGSSCVPN